MVERWHQETSSFHLPVGEITITLDDVACLLDILVAGRLTHEEDLDHDHSVELLVTHLLFPMEDAIGQVSDFGASVTFTALKDRYDHLLNKCNHLLEENLSEEDEQELRRIRPACVKAFLLLLVGYMLFANKNNKTISLLWMLAIRDLANIDTWSWGAM
ncbi:protein MAINTENANCE OF MERISTEMS-like [Medicago truncatula]|uniref:protein MAINTENANCE OF MERISTEMS-like n=1 Tax=Medicago truncatula TaxID=3880 RepID=UPI000D2F2272|nr:protein MAINTENANCE OF MERISTEMS-like [Medicago truncatula]